MQLLPLHSRPGKRGLIPAAAPGQPWPGALLIKWRPVTRYRCNGRVQESFRIWRTGTGYVQLDGEGYGLLPQPGR